MSPSERTEGKCSCYEYDRFNLLLCERKTDIRKLRAEGLVFINILTLKRVCVSSVHSLSVLELKQTGTKQVPWYFYQSSLRNCTNLKYLMWPCVLLFCRVTCTSDQRRPLLRLAAALFPFIPPCEWRLNCLGGLITFPPHLVLQACSLTELDEKINAVKAALLKRVNEFGPGYGTECPL